MSLQKLWDSIKNALGEALKWLPLVGPLLNEKIRVKMAAGDAAAVGALADAIDEYRDQWGDVSTALRAGINPDSQMGRDLTVEEIAKVTQQLVDVGPASEALLAKIRAL